MKANSNSKQGEKKGIVRKEEEEEEEVGWLRA
jgi:hypothetical protein